MDEFEKMMAEYDEWLVDAKEQIKASGRIDPAILDTFIKIIQNWSALNTNMLIICLNYALLRLRKF